MILIFHTRPLRRIIVDYLHYIISIILLEIIKVDIMAELVSVSYCQNGIKGVFLTANADQNGVIRQFSALWQNSNSDMY